MQILFAQESRKKCDARLEGRPTGTKGFSVSIAGAIAGGRPVGTTGAEGYSVSSGRLVPQQLRVFLLQRADQ